MTIWKFIQSKSNRGGARKQPTLPSLKCDASSRSFCEQPATCTNILVVVIQRLQVHQLSHARECAVDGQRVDLLELVQVELVHVAREVADRQADRRLANSATLAVSRHAHARLFVRRATGHSSERQQPARFRSTKAAQNQQLEFESSSWRQQKRPRVV